MARVLGLRTVSKKHLSYNGFRWPSSGKVTAPDWDATPRCGGGLHALLGGIGNGGLLNLEADAIWQAVWIDEDKIVDLDGKVKFPWCKIACEGTREEVVRFMVKHGADVTKMVGGIVFDDKVAVANGMYGQATANGYRGKATANGLKGQATANGYRGKATANGSQGQATANGNLGKATANGYCGRAMACGQNSQAIANGDHGHAVTTHPLGQATANGVHGFASALGNYSQATANGEKGRATAGRNGVAIANGEGGRACSEQFASAGPGGVITISGSDYAVVGHVGENNIKPCVLYQARVVDHTYKLVPSEIRRD